MVCSTKKNAEEVKTAMLGFDKVLGILEHVDTKVPNEIKTLLKEREKARKEKDFKKADTIRKMISEKGWIVQDTPEGTKIRKRI